MFTVPPGLLSWSAFSETVYCVVIVCVTATPVVVLVSVTTRSVAAKTLNVEREGRGRAVAG
jgi:hypothetical protein